MQVHKNIQALPAIKNAVITIGTFDGVHTGHVQIIEQLKQEAAKCNGETVIITFNPHPRKVLVSKKPLFLLNTMEEKIALLEQHGIDHLVVVSFNEAFAQQPAEAYVEDFLWTNFKPHTLIIGYDHRFGKGRSGDYHLMEDYSKKLGFKLLEITQYVIHQSGVSSTRIRECLQTADIDEANTLLGYQYFFNGLVIEGNKLGRTIGYPTANLQILDEEKLVPANGVYAVMVEIKNEYKAPRYFKGMMNIGIRPTVDGKSRVIEVNIFDFDENIYGLNITVSLYKHLRDEIKFNGLEALKQQLANDKIMALSAL